MTTSNTEPKVSGGAFDEDHGRRYIECTESSCFNIVRDSYGFSSGGDDKLAAIVIGIIKLHALCGGSIAIDAMGLCGSQILLRLFADRAFRDFLAKQPQFIKIVSVYSEPGRREGRRAVALAGFARALDPGWYSTNFPEQDPIIGLSEIILRADRLDPEAMKSDRRSNSFANLVARWPSYAKLLEGSLYAAWHFTENVHAPFAAAEPSQRVHELLRLTLEKERVVVPEHYKLIKGLMDFIEHRCDSGISATHSEIIRTVQAHENDRKNAVEFLQTASHAFNAALFRAIEPDYGAYEFFSHGAPIGLYLNSRRDVLVATNWGENETTRTLRLLRMCRFDWDPMALRWADVCKVLAEPAALESSWRFQRVCKSGDPTEILDALNAHVAILRRYLPRPRAFKPTPWTWVIKEILLVIGVSADWFYDLRGGASAAATVGAGVLDVIEKLPFGLPGYLMAEVLTDKMDKMIPREQIMDESNKILRRSQGLGKGPVRIPQGKILNR